MPGDAIRSWASTCRTSCCTARARHAVQDEDITAVYFFHYTPDAIIVSADSPYRTFADLVKAAREKPDSISLAGSGTNSANHLAHERLDRELGIKTLYVPFKGTGDLVSAVLGNHVSGAMSYSTLAIQQKGKMRMLAVATDKRLPQFPDVPTFKELGLNWVDGAYRGIAVPKSTPPEIRKAVSDMMDAVNKDPDLRKRMTEGGFEVTDISLEQIPAFVKERSVEYLTPPRAGDGEEMRGRGVSRDMTMKSMDSGIVFALCSAARFWARCCTPNCRSIIGMATRRT